MISDEILKDGISNKTIREMTGAEKMEEFLRAEIAIVRAHEKDE